MSDRRNRALEARTMSDPDPILTEEERRAVDLLCLQDCYVCGGSGTEEYVNVEPCSYCGGAGQYPRGENHHLVQSAITRLSKEVERLREVERVHVEQLVPQLEMWVEQAETREDTLRQQRDELGEEYKRLLWREYKHEDDVEAVLKQINAYLKEGRNNATESQ